jgi:hypothetical protein
MMTRTVGDKVEQLGHNGRVLGTGRIIAIVTSPGARVPVFTVEWGGIAEGITTHTPLQNARGNLVQYRVTPI